MLAYSVALILVMIFKPTGLLGTYEFSLFKLIKTGRGKRAKEKPLLTDTAATKVEEKEES